MAPAAGPGPGVPALNNGDFDIDDRLQTLVGRITDSYAGEPRTRHIGRGHLPNRSEIIEMINLLLEITYPGFFGRKNLTFNNMRYHVGDVLPRLAQAVYDRIFHALCHHAETQNQYDADLPTVDRRPFDLKARELTTSFIERIPEIRDLLALDVQAAYDGDPASCNTDEVILAYPGVLAVTVYRYAHVLWEMEVPLVPRIMAEWVHQITGIDIHPGAKIGRSFFIDHGTGVVIGETAEIGDQVKIYQGVTLGALSFLKDERGRMVRGYKRHPTVRDRVTIYANAIILGGETVLGEGCTIGGSTFLTSSVPAGCTVNVMAPELKVRQRTPKDAAQHGLDFSI